VLNYTCLLSSVLNSLTHTRNMEITCFGGAMVAQARFLGFDSQPFYFPLNSITLLLLLAVAINWGEPSITGWSCQSCLLAR